MIHFHRKKQETYFSNQLKQLRKPNPEYGTYIGLRRGWFGITTKFFKLQDDVPKNLVKATGELNRNHARKMLLKNLSPEEQAASYFMLNRSTGQITEEYMQALVVLAAKEKSMRLLAQGRMVEPLVLVPPPQADSDSSDSSDSSSSDRAAYSATDRTPIRKELAPFSSPHDEEDLLQVISFGDTTEDSSENPV